AARCVAIWLAVFEGLAEQGLNPYPAAPASAALARLGAAARALGGYLAGLFGFLASVLRSRSRKHGWLYGGFISYTLLFTVFVTGLMGFLLGFITGASFGYFTGIDMFGCIYVSAPLFSLSGIILGVASFVTDVRAKGEVAKA